MAGRSGADKAGGDKKGKSGGKEASPPVPAKAAPAAAEETSLDDEIEAALRSHQGQSVTNKLKAFADQSDANLQSLANAIKRLLREGKG